MMLVYGLRLLVALVTFGVGVAASSLAGSRGRPCGKRVYSYTVLEAAPPLDVPPPPPRGGGCFAFARPVIKGGVLQGKAISKPTPLYPPDAKAAGISGVVTVQVVVNESGRVEAAEAVSGPEALREAAETAARQARFSPTLLSGMPVKVSGVITYNFVLQ